MAHKKIKKAARKLAKKTPSDKEIADKINELAKIWLQTPGLPGSASPNAPWWDPLLGSTTTSIVEGVPLTQTPAVMPGTVIPEFLRDAIRDLQFPGQAPPKPRVRSPKQKRNDKIQSVALTAVNIKARKKDGSWKKGWNQRRVMKEAQKRCTKERERLGLCKRKPKRRRKTRRHGYETVLKQQRRVR